MAKPVCRILIPASLSEAFEIISALLEKCGLRPGHPDHGMLIARGNNGEARLMSAEDLRAGLTGGHTGSLAFWSDGTHDVMLSWKSEPNGYMFSLRLDHLDSAKAATVCGCLVQAVLGHLAEHYRHEQALVIAFG